MTHDKTRQLENRIDKLESTIEKMMPSRRDALKMGGAALAGGSLMAGTASAGTNQVGTIGSPSQLVDIESEDINNADTITTDTLDSTTLNNSGTVTTQDINVNQNVNGADTTTAAAGEALTSDGSGGLSFAEVGGGVPPNFSYSDQSANRTLETTFTNNTGKALYVNVSVTAGAQTFAFFANAVIDGVIIQQHSQRNANVDISEVARNQLVFFVPDGSTYEVQSNNNASIHKWFEAEM